MADTKPALTDSEEREPDIVLVVLQRMRHYLPSAITTELLTQIEGEIKTQYGGQRVRIPKRRKHLSPQDKAAVYAQGLTKATDQQIQTDTGVSRATIYRIMKSGPSRLT